MHGVQADVLKSRKCFKKPTISAMAVFIGNLRGHILWRLRPTDGQQAVLRSDLRQYAVINQAVEVMVTRGASPRFAQDMAI